MWIRNKKYRFVAQTDSTNRLLKSLLRDQHLPEGYVVRSGYQLEGRGQGSNRWESQPGRNLLFSVLLRPVHVAVDEQFILSQMVALAIHRSLQELLPEEATAFSLKWPNDIYWNNRKLGGILIENSLRGGKITECIIGIGLNINQLHFYSDAPNPVSLCQISGRRHRLMNVLRNILHHLFEIYVLADYAEVRGAYAQALYRREGYHSYFAPGNGRFEARILRVEADGRLVLKEKTGQESGYYFKEVEFLLPASGHT
ncbi:MAG: biotin--[acetyl-CoA-carboxylase] ligase [Paludibacter sp.]|jgi:BirA family biotin operon repressor/biotin-[acetyl-CoA-carboxylase] ligase|nr:biotin--[acetyl-CoA-carboxylase] ligase [Paludibacter sp.]